MRKHCAKRARFACSYDLFRERALNVPPLSQNRLLALYVALRANHERTRISYLRIAVTCFFSRTKYIHVTCVP